MQFLKKLPREKIIEILSRLFPGADPVTLRAAICLFGLSRELSSAHERLVASRGLSRGRFALLMYLQTMTREGATPTEAAENIGVKPASVTGLTDGLEREGLVRRRPDPVDRRRTLLAITPKGEEHLKEILPWHMAKLELLLQELSTGEKENLVTLLDKVRRAIPEMDRP